MESLFPWKWNVWCFFLLHVINIYLYSSVSSFFCILYFLHMYGNRCILWYLNCQEPCSSTSTFWCFQRRRSGLKSLPPTIKLSKTLVFELKASKVNNFYVVTGSWDIESYKQESETSAWDCFTAIGVMENVFRSQCCSNGQKFLHCVYWNGIWTCSSKGMFVFSSLHLF